MSTRSSSSVKRPRVKFATALEKQKQKKQQQDHPFLQQEKGFLGLGRPPDAQIDNNHNNNNNNKNISLVLI